MVDPATPFIESLAGFATDIKLEDLPPDVVYHAKLTILDTFGVALAAGGHSGCREVVSYVRASSGLAAGGAAATVWGAGLAAPAAEAAYANGYLSNTLDFDEGWHLGTIIIPAVTALAETQPGAAGADLLIAYVAGREAGDRIRAIVEIGRDQGTGPTRRGWWHPGLVGPIAAAVGCARLLALPASQAADAAAVACCSSGGFRQAMGTVAKALHSANAARDGLNAARLAQLGFAADHRMLDGPVGFLNALELPRDAVPQILATLGTAYELEPPPRFKLFPVCGAGQDDIGAVVAWRATQDPGRLSRICRVLVDFHRFSMFRFDARGDVEAGFSMSYAVAASLVDGAFGLAQVSGDRLHDPAIRSLMARVQDRPGTTDAAVVVEFDDGSREAIAPSGWPAWTEPEIVDKFLACASGVIPVATAEAIVKTILHLEDAESVVPLAELLGGLSRAA
jgi:2-methylcitrate dehydratase PrpD